jgi:hypothetical protein
MATIKKAQLGGLIKKGVKAATSAAPKKTMSLTDKVKEAKFQKNKGKFGMTEDITLKEFKKGAKKIGKDSESYSTSPPSKPVVLTDAQKENNARILKEIREGKRKNGGPVKKKMKNGGSLSGLKASNKRVGPVDPKGAFTKVQKKTLAGSKGKASLTKDKQLGATKMAKCGTKMSKK